MWGRKCDAFFQSTGRLTSLPGSFGTCTNRNQTIISRRLRALITPARLAERPDGLKLRSARSIRCSCRDHSAGKSMRRALVHSCLGNNRLVRSSSPPSPTTQSYANRDFPARPRIAPDRRDSWAHFISASYRLDFRGRFGALVSAPQNPVSRQRRLVLAEMRLDGSGENSETSTRR